ncbi:MAG: 16S rRNA (cytidine(1402)-2'-O)-methyltransferase [Desulfurivibrionaceae bacterium]|nr:16S rRNA (cytidine(1402)-2'-O)-methyltransferase [Desulfurivibrionaceae bacterium]
MKSGGVEGSGVLYVVATPIGNLEDITRRAVRILAEVALIAAEDTRHTRKLLASLDIHTPLVSYYKGQEFRRSRQVIEKLQRGEDVALVSDAGTPAVSDPGAVLVRQAIEGGIRVVPVPGPSALTAAVSVAGLEEGGFLFVGFLPGKKGERHRLLQSLSEATRPLVFYESPRRIIKSLRECLGIFGERAVFLCRELTKLHEELFHGRLSAVIDDLEARPLIKGEFVVIIGAAVSENSAPAGAELEDILVWYRDQSGLSMRDVCRKVAADLGLSRSEVYSRALTIWKG